MLSIVAVGSVTPWEVRLVLGVLEVNWDCERDQKVTGDGTKGRSEEALDSGGQAEDSQERAP